jgi:Cof subfamily protein (haloacid dehalogenase superfamily)
VATEIKLVALDLDGTLLDRQRRCSDRNRRALEAVAERGVQLVLASGRMHHSVEEEAGRLGLSGPIISYNGAMICEAGADTPLLHQPVAAELAAGIVQMAVETRAHLQYFVAGEAALKAVGDQAYRPGGTRCALPEALLVPRVSHWARLYQRRAGSRPHPVGDLRRLAGTSPTKMIVIAPPETVEELLPRYEARYRDQLYVTRSLPEYIEFLDRRVSKGAALGRLAEHLGIPIEATMGCGDELNDLPLVEAAGVGVAMPSAAPEVKAAADFVPSSDTEGVAEALEKYVLR